MKPNKPGEWHSRDEQKIVVYEYDGKLWFAENGVICPRPRAIRELKGDDWLPAIPPTFPELPPKPELCLCEYDVHGTSGRMWRAWGRNVPMIATPISVRVVPHPDNDDEAIKLIKDAKRG